MTTSAPALPSTSDIDWAAIGPWPIETSSDSPEGLADLDELLEVQAEAEGDSEGARLAYQWAICELTRGDFDKIAAGFNVQECRALIDRYTKYEVVTDAWETAVGIVHQPGKSFYMTKIIPALRRRLARLERPSIPIQYTGESPIARIKRTISVESVAERYTTLRPAGPGKLKGLCPLHSETDASFYVYVDTQRWRCYGGCARGGDVLDLGSQLGMRGML
jgi:hypothetical protein